MILYLLIVFSVQNFYFINEIFGMVSKKTCFGPIPFNEMLTDISYFLISLVLFGFPIIISKNNFVPLTPYIALNSEKFYLYDEMLFMIYYKFLENCNLKKKENSLVQKNILKESTVQNCLKFLNNLFKIYKFI